VPRDIAKRHRLLPLDYHPEHRRLTIAIADPNDIVALDRLRALIAPDLLVDTVLAGESEIARGIDQHYGHELSIDGILHEIETGEIDFRSLAASSDEYSQPVVRLIDALLTDAVKRDASDIHFEPEASFLRIRYRIDGILQEKQKLPRNIQAGVLSRIKIMSNMDIAERRKPQDGRISLRIENKAIDFRVSSLPTIFGEKIVLRILDKSSAMVPLENLGFLSDTLDLFNSVISQPYGMIIISGPTGAGKTTTLYSVLNRLNMPGKNIVTVEDPVEYQMDGINQVQVNVKAEMTFANGLRSILRQDPNIVLIGEIRDGETAQIAIEAALTGHLVLSTLHTNDAPSVATRLIDMGIEPFLIASSLIGATAQRLARKICPDCKQPYVPPASALEGLGLSTRGKLEDVTFYKGVGCAKCGGSGYKGRTGIHEMMKVDDELRRLILHKASARDVSQAARSHGMRTLLEDALVKAREGIITLEEVLRVVSTVESE
jgi:type II secretory ATPase GspE/PulE/Tfp pilus assembly ATPase PilB-like protein